MEWLCGCQKHKLYFLLIMLHSVVELFWYARISAVDLREVYQGKWIVLLC